METTEIAKALVRRPSPRLAQGLVTHIERSAIDLDLARSQWQGYVDALRSQGWETIEVDPAPDCPDSVFIEDAVVVYGRTAVVTRPGADERKPEVEAAERAVTALGYDVKRIEAPGTLDGGDVLKYGGRVWVGQGGRTNEEGLRQLREHLAPEGAETIGVPLTRVLHLKSAVTALPDGTVIGYEPLWTTRRCGTPSSRCPRRAARTSSSWAATGFLWPPTRRARPSCSGRAATRSSRSTSPSTRSSRAA